ncbi:hypothetical protein [Microbacterium sp. SCN 69-37]|uniref:hypothetical protein n=1 Tax=Microbacterium sp. SCN 69-37 TaxID=1660115 RepID=UPI00086B6426|nr:hypothetical protein [Microbacterium sp. SCN 69-37]ODT25439.1 MAG: hypothetical protein ABS64_01950 [Microbacterium sp. SCN 69-37]
MLQQIADGGQTHESLRRLVGDAQRLFQSSLQHEPLRLHLAGQGRAPRVAEPPERVQRATARLAERIDVAVVLRGGRVHDRRERPAPYGTVRKLALIQPQVRRPRFVSTPLLAGPQSSAEDDGQDCRQLRIVIPRRVGDARDALRGQVRGRGVEHGAHEHRHGRHHDVGFAGESVRGGRGRVQHGRQHVEPLTQLPDPQLRPCQAHLQLAAAGAEAGRGGEVLLVGVEPSDRRACRRRPQGAVLRERELRHHGRLKLAGDLQPARSVERVQSVLAHRLEQPVAAA